MSFLKKSLSMALFLLTLPLTPQGLAAEDQEALARRLLDHTDDLHRGASSHGTMSMHVKTARFERTLEMEFWSQGEDRSLVRILRPASEAGMATLKVDQNIWNYMPKVDRTMKVPPSMMGGSWMGSHFTNDDLVKGSRMADDYTYTLSLDPSGQYLIECVPRPDAPVVWGKVLVELRKSDEIPTRIRYFDERGELARTMTFEDIRTMGKRTLPTRMRLSVENKPGELTEISYADIQFEVVLPESTFSLQGLKQ